MISPGLSEDDLLWILLYSSSLIPVAAAAVSPFGLLLVEFDIVIRIDQIAQLPHACLTFGMLSASTGALAQFQMICLASIQLT